VRLCSVGEYEFSRQIWQKKFGAGCRHRRRLDCQNRPNIKIEGIDVLIPGPIHTFRFAYLTASRFPSLKKRSTLFSLWTYYIIPAMPEFSCVKQLGSPAVT